MATSKLLQAACAPSPLALAASAALSAWSGDMYDAVAALVFLLTKLLAVVWARRRCEGELQRMGVTDDSDFGELAQLMGRTSAFLGACLAFFLFLADPEEAAGEASVGTARALSRSMALCNITLMPTVLPLGLQICLVQGLGQMTAVPRGARIVERAARMRLLCVDGPLEEDPADLAGLGVRCLTLMDAAETDLWPASHRRDRRVLEHAQVACAIARRQGGSAFDCCAGGRVDGLSSAWRRRTCARRSADDHCRGLRC